MATMTVEKRTAHIATLGPDVRLVVFQFLLNRELVPAVVDSKRHSTEEVEHKKTGESVLQSTPGVYLLEALDGICPITEDGPYELVDAWKEFYEMDWGKLQLRYVFCHREHVRPDRLYPDFVAKRDELIESLVGLLNDNLWATMAHMNPYFNKGVSSGHRVLMIDCAGRKKMFDEVGNPVMVFRGGKDPVTKHGIGPKVPLSTLAAKLKLVGDLVWLESKP